ncbi:MAG: Inosose dehydratase [uncultured Rubrobacteraceae bacterium]|uniref:Inosose dehydratase n=1 Tax=uncultured Rubrobacteraceae bacterium TaxID=349277 RepID=A0A6J4R4F0_9ACTN|nr:MAG: Inosose dehydratase [uncultured Rubrobacteraceae bacterium]
MSARIAGAPVSWGVIEIPDWGYQMPADRVLKEASSLGLSAVEAGPEGLLPSDPSEVSDLLARYDLKLVGGFVPAVLHEPGVREDQLGLVEKRARFFAAAGADVVVLAVMSGSDDFGPFVKLGDDAWKRLFESLKMVEEICGRHGIAVSMHHHYGTAIESDGQLKRFLEGSEMGLCLDTGHLVLGGSDPVEIAQIAGTRVNHAHLKDVDLGVAGRLAARELSFREAAQRNAFRPLGEGDVDLGAVLGRLGDAGYSGWYVLEQDSVVEGEPPEGEGPVNEVGKSLAYLRERLE